MKFTSIFFTASESISEVHLKDSYKRANKQRLFTASTNYLRDLSQR